MKSNIEGSDKKKVGFYLVTNPETAETYAGSGILGARYKVHLTQLQKGIHPNYRLQEAFNRNPNFEFVGLPLEELTPEETRELAFDLEQSFIDEYDKNPLLLNLARDARYNFNGAKHTEEANERNRQKTAARWKDPEWREKVTRAQKAGWASLSEEEKQAYSEDRSRILKELYESGKRQSTAGQVRPDEFKEGASLRTAELWQDPEFKAKMSAARKGNRNAPMKACSIDGTVYPSLKEAAQALGMSTPGIVYRIESVNWPNWSYL